MDEFIKTITSLSWWIGVVGVSFLINLLSAYAKSPLDTIFGGVSRYWQQRSEWSRAKREALIEALRSNEHLQVLYLAREHRQRLQEIAWLALSCILTMLSVWAKLLTRFPAEAGKTPVPVLFIYVVGGTGMLCLIFAFASRMSASTYMSLVEEAAFEDEDRYLSSQRTASGGR